MSKILFQTVAAALLLPILTLQLLSQTAVCKKDTFAALQTIPKLKYKCGDENNDYEEKILKLPERLSAISRYTKSLENFTFANWWQASVNDLNLCDFKHKPGILTKEEKKQFENGEYLIDLFGDHQIRVIRAADPCYQTGYGGSNIFLLYRKNGKVYASEIIDGYFSRADMIFVNFALNGNEQIIEVATSSGGLNPTITNYYFTIDKKTNKAIPKKLFIEDGKKMSNQITSMMLLGEAAEYGLPPRTEPLQIIKNNRLAKSFDIVMDTYETFGEEKHQKFSRATLHWNGKFYQ